MDTFKIESPAFVYKNGKNSIDSTIDAVEVKKLYNEPSIQEKELPPLNPESDQE